MCILNAMSCQQWSVFVRNIVAAPEAQCLENKSSRVYGQTHVISGQATSRTAWLRSSTIVLT
jgi:hypothetical protein